MSGGNKSVPIRRQNSLIRRLSNQITNLSRRLEASSRRQPLQPPTIRSAQTTPRDRRVQHCGNIHQLLSSLDSQCLSPQTRQVPSLNIEAMTVLELLGDKETRSAIPLSLRVEDPLDEVAPSKEDRGAESTVGRPLQGDDVLTLLEAEHFDVFDAKSDEFPSMAADEG